MRHFAVVGSGPGGFYTAEALNKAYGDQARVDILDRYPVPYGLVRFGVAPDHQSLKAVSKRYDSTAETPGVDFIGNVTVGRDVSIGELLETSPRVGRLVRRGERRRIAYAGLGAVDEFLTVGRAGRLQVILSTIEPGGGTGPESYSHDSDEECLVVLEGRLDLWVGDDHVELGEGDAITYPSRVPHRNMNPGPAPARVLFCMTPPSY